MRKYFCFVDYNGDYVICRDIGGGESVVIERLPSEELARELIGCLEGGLQRDAA